MTTRRQFLRQSAAAALSATAINSLGAPLAMGAPFIHTDKTGVAREKRPSLVIIYLRGGADPLNTIIPYTDPEYYAVRQTIAVPNPRVKPDPNSMQQPSIPLDRRWALHPAMMPLVDLYKKGSLAAVVAAGSTHETRSHFDAQDFMEWAAPGIKSIQEGWLNRYMQMTAKENDHYLRGFSPQALLPRSLRGQYSVLAAPGRGSRAALNAFEDLYKPCEEKQELNEKNRAEKASSDGKKKKKRKIKGLPDLPPVDGEELSGHINNAGVNTVQKLRHLNKILEGDAEKRGYPRGGLGQQLSDIASVIKAGEPLEIAAVDYNGWDHHSYQVTQQARMLGYLSNCIAAFVKDLGEARMENVMVLTMTEFGRTVRENGSQGTDHGHGGFMLAIGGRVNGGKVYGKWSGLQMNRLYRKRDVPVTVDFRDVFADTLEGLYKFPTRDNDFFPGFKPLNKPLNMIRRV